LIYFGFSFTNLVEYDGCDEGVDCKDPSLILSLYVWDHDKLGPLYCSLHCYQHPWW